MNEGLICQKLTQALHCVKVFYDAGLCGKITNSEGLKKLLEKKSALLAHCSDLLLDYPRFLKSSNIPSVRA